MTTRIIKYIPKHTGANTQYREITPEDQLWIQMQLIRYLTVMGGLDQARDEDSRWVREQWWHKRTDKVHRGTNGQNTPCSMVSGILNNMLFKPEPQRDFTDKQMEDIEYISAVMGQSYPGCEPVRFQIGYDIE